MSEQCTCISWNVRGLGTTTKRSQVFSIIRQTKAKMICLQEMHMTKDSLNYLKKPWVNHIYHSYHASYSRGVSMLIHRSVPWECISYKCDSVGRYVFIYAILYSLPFVLMGMYNPPHAGIQVVKNAVLFMAQYSDAYVICMGDFNMLLDSVLDRCGGVSHNRVNRENILKTLFSEIEWSDLWRIGNPQTRRYSWSAPGESCLSRIDMTCGNGKVQPLMQSITYLPRGVSDHSPLMFRLNIGPRGSYPTWKMHSYWLSQIGPNDRIPDQLIVIFEAHENQAIEGTLWDAFKAYLRGVLKSTISYIK